MADPNSSMNPSPTPPPGWSMDPKDLDYEDDWVAEDGCGTMLAAKYKLERCTPIMIRLDPHNDVVLFESGGKFYLYSQMTGAFSQIIVPDTLDEIIAVMKGERRRKNLVQKAIT
ncbi:uncharacterized protein TRUGW13939_07208 [Talaromyces rugulosus]|uniref:Uncharacterized protein n=1 Tax=Talaromyces rugulosus TaxID=121627 RepID=A0A7H8R1X3_TALRU|nr:uncharacterized protein TRUGW13939_07208 [Talaromyces rugulosus]QKX60066.1 hypothetical protein TRUGW13939_07208 [Talaromyces rugulosus]